MHLTRPTIAVASLLLAPILIGCGAEEEADPPASQAASDRPATSDPATSDPATDAPSVAADGTVAQASLTEEQTRLHAAMLLFEDVARATTGDGFGGKSGTLTDGEHGDLRIPDPESLAVVDKYSIEWAEGKLTGYTLSTDSGEEMSREGGPVFIVLAADHPHNADLRTDAAKLGAAIDDWIATYGEIPSLGSGFSELTLEPGMFDEYKADAVELELQEGIDSRNWSRVNDWYEVGLTSEATGESAVIDQDGVHFFRQHEIV